MEWKEDIFDNFVKLKRGYDLPDQNIVEGVFPIVASTSIKAFHKYFKVKGPGVVTGRSGSLGTVQYIHDEFWPLNTTLYAKDFKGNLPQFVYYFLQVLHLENFNSGAGVPSLNQNHLHKVKINIPPPGTQKKIAAVLSGYDDLIENNKRRIAILEKIAEEIYGEWFVRMRFPGHETTKFEKGVPNSWQIKRLDQVLELRYGKSLKESSRVPGDIPVYGSSGIVGTHNKALVKDGGIIVGRKGNVGSVHWSDTSFFPIDTAFYVHSSVSNYYLFYLLKSLNFLNNDAAVPGLSRSQAYSLKFYFPGDQEITEFVEVIKPMFDAARLTRKQNVILESTRNILLPRLISGKLSVEDLDIQFPPSMIEEEQSEPEAAYA